LTVQNAIWTIGADPQQLERGALPSEQVLHEMLIAAPEILGRELMVVGSEVRTPHGKFVDLLAVDPAGTIVIVELKRERTSRDVVAQALDYASWAQTLRMQEIEEIYRSYSGHDLSEEFLRRFNTPIDPDQVGASHQIIIAASELDSASERIVEYLTSLGVAINVVFFNVFKHGKELLLSRAWLNDPAEVQSTAISSSGKQATAIWNGEYYVSFGTSEDRSWADAVKYGYISAGGGSWYSRTLGLLSVGDRVWVNIPGSGYVGVGIVTGPKVIVGEFVVGASGKEKNFLDIVSYGAALKKDSLDPEVAEYMVPVKWLDTVPEAEAIRGTNWFGNQNSVARPRADKWLTTVEGLKRHFKHWDDK